MHRVAGAFFVLLVASAARAAEPFLDRVQAEHAPPPQTAAESIKIDVDRLLADAELALVPPTEPGVDAAKAQKPDPKRALALFQRALAAAPTRAAPLWGLSRAHDALGNKEHARHYAALVVRSPAADRTDEMRKAAAWRLELPR